MRNIHGYILLCLVLMLCIGARSAAVPQRNYYDKALDKYAAICDRCMELRARTESGQGVGMEELKALLVELSSLRRTLSNASGKMSAAQAERFEAIKARYQQGMKAFEKPDRLAFSTIPKMKPVTGLVEVTYREPYSKSLRQAQRPERQAQRLDVESRQPTESMRLNAPWRPSSSKESLSRPFRLAVLADVGISPVPSYGAMAALTWNGLGAYVNYRSNFRKNEYSYACTSDGATEYGRIWATGDSRESRTVVTAGLVMFPSQRFGFYAGAGLTSYRPCWQDVSGQWVNVQDKSFGNFAVDAGIFLNFSSLVLSIGVGSDFRGHADLQFGAGIRF